MNKVLDVQNLHVSFDTYAGEVKAVRGVTFSLSEGEVLAIVGESGCGKSVTAQTIMKLNPMPPARIKEGSVQLGLTFLFIAHDLNIVKYISDRIAVMYLGNVVELASSDDLYAHTLHPYSKALLSAVPIPDPSAEAQKHRQILSGDVPSPINTPKGCNFAGRCPVACDKCRESKPQLREIRPGHFCACHLYDAPEEQVTSTKG